MSDQPEKETGVAEERDKEVMEEEWEETEPVRINIKMVCLLASHLNFLEMNKNMNKQNLRLGRPRRRRRVRFSHRINYYKPQGTPLCNLEVEEISVEDLEALRLKNVKDLDQNECAQKMNISQSTFQRVLSEAYKKISHALINGKAIRIVRD